MTDPLALDNVTVRIRERVILDRVTLAVPAGSVFALLGRNGAGKTTAFRCLLGQRRPDEGRALLFGQDAWTHRASAMARLGVVPEEPDVPPDMTPRALAKFTGPLYRTFNGAEYAARLRHFGIDDRTAFGRLSRGQKTQVLLAIALATHPEALVLDDPTLGLDTIARRELLAELVRDLADHGTTTLISTHDFAAVEGLATHIGVMRDGKLVLAGELEKIKASYGQVDADPLRASGDLSTSLEEVFIDLVERQRGAA
ncbi:MAG: ATP-binding cassette domain-containing protein [Deltaproteobacteria bacterium]|nr:ATP-binding cassette domain-containing protein [Deltaproteobacteria bacterium]MDQ3296199.1 ATP-binding cassette domain-containing protein [Myxococcota bacterium]